MYGSGKPASPSLQQPDAPVVLCMYSTVLGSCGRRLVYRDTVISDVVSAVGAEPQTPAKKIIVLVNSISLFYFAACTLAVSLFTAG